MLAGYVQQSCGQILLYACHVLLIFIAFQGITLNESQESSTSENPHEEDRWTRDLLAA